MLSPPGRGPRHHHQAANSSSRSQILLSAPVLLQGPPVDHPVVERSGPRVGGLSHRRACPEHPGTPEKLREPDNPLDPETDWLGQDTSSTTLLNPGPQHRPGHNWKCLMDTCQLKKEARSSAGKITPDLIFWTVHWIGCT